jgi:hypothetical protein
MNGRREPEMTDTPKETAMKHRYLYLLAAPAVAGLLVAAGCDEDDDVGTIDTPDSADVDRATPAAGTEGGIVDRAGGAFELPEAQREKLSQMLEDAQESAEAYKDRIEANVDIEGWGTGNAASQRLGEVNEKLDAIQGAVNDGEWATVATEFKALAAMPMPADLKQQVSAIANELKSANIPGLADFQMPDVELPSIPGVPTPGETGGTTPPTTRPGGAGGA